MSSSSLEDLSEPKKTTPRTTQGMVKVGPDEMTPGRLLLRSWLGKYFRIVITDGRILVGIFSCTDKDANVILSGCVEYITEDGEPRILGNVMVPGKHIRSVEVEQRPNDDPTAPLDDNEITTIEVKSEISEEPKETASGSSADVSKAEENKSQPIENTSSSEPTEPISKPEEDQKTEEAAALPET